MYLVYIHMYNIGTCSGCHEEIRLKEERHYIRLLHFLFLIVFRLYCRLPSMAACDWPPDAYHTHTHLEGGVHSFE